MELVLARTHLGSHCILWRSSLTSFVIGRSRVFLAFTSVEGLQSHGWREQDSGKSELPCRGSVRWRRKDVARVSPDCAWSLPPSSLTSWRASSPKGPIVSTAEGPCFLEDSELLHKSHHHGSWKVQKRKRSHLPVSVLKSSRVCTLQNLLRLVVDFVERKLLEYNFTVAVNLFSKQTAVGGILLVWS